MTQNQVKSRQRVTEHGEVFTAEREVKAMCDLVKHETERIDSRFLEPACGEGNFLIEILARKLFIVSKKYKKSSYDWERNSLLALGSIYGIDLLADNAKACRDRLYVLWDKEYKAACKKECNDETRSAARFILERNIVCGNALTLLCVDDEQHDTTEPIVFSEWTFPFNDARIQRKDYTFAELVNLGNPEEKKETNSQQSLFDLYSETETKPNEEGIFLHQYITHYRRLNNNG